MEIINEGIREAERKSFIKRALLLTLLLVIAIVTLNIYLWKDESKQRKLDAQMLADESLFEPAYEDDFSVDKLNSQVSVKQLRKALWNDELPLVSSDSERLSSPELEASIARLYNEIEQLEK
ncbi:hypothetical protein GCM10007906_43990 [Vibrio hyugaensis]|uniref:Uncharacterized protein n=1 Tax=Vibrio hyugaensis TaxID=1534743 RepID=A0ABQ5Y7A4_9VIBR|nr:hypothetical protein [Vibrio hyugaensis]GLR06811.1 hypothetical protein GCM10007906_43990 [Vibrio hyugaensis]